MAVKTLLIDTEATDLIRNTLLPLDKQPRVFELCGVLVDDDWSVVREIDFRCDPGVPIPEMAERITGIRTADVAGLPPLADFWPDVKDVMAAADRLVAHNLTYDLQVLRFEAERLGDDLPVPDDLLCTVEATIHYRGFRLSLTRLYEHLFGETFVDAHRAKSDVMALMRCYRALVERGDA